MYGCRIVPFKKSTKTRFNHSESSDAVPEIPVTVKIRIGWDETSINAIEIGHLVESVGAKALTIHGRTKVQGYRGDANWDVISEVAGSIKIPVIGNGSITSASEVIQIKNHTNCAGIMIGRAALGYPWIFRDIKYSLKHGKLPNPPSIKERWKTIIEFTENIMARDYQKQRHKDIKWMRPKIIALTKEMRGSRKIRTELGKVAQIEDLKKLAELHISHYGNDFLIQIPLYYDTNFIFMHGKYLPLPCGTLCLSENGQQSKPCRSIFHRFCGDNWVS